MMNEDRARHLVTMALTELNPHQRELLILNEVKQYSVTQMAELLDLPYTTVYPRLQRAKKVFHRALDALLDE